ncbi:acyl-CoA dehydrogenase [uncultured Jatrophihabitans sp.]|uniref:acyl-CoA dehydrogenase n=1 Tax=uncultured Jatrophihabitans sp. TaxID=1610747 RepID=UPI0035CA542B
MSARVAAQPIEHGPGASSADLSARARACGEDVASALELARDIGTALPLPGSGNTAGRWQVLTQLGRANLTVARVVEAHTDALAILAESGRDMRAEHRTWGVFAAEAPGVRLAAEPAENGRVTLSGVKPWCSLGGALDAALVTAYLGTERGLYAVELQRCDVRADPPERWVARGLRTVTSGPVTFTDSPAERIGAPGWYLHRPGFAWGGIGVAACWLGGALGLADTLFAARPRPFDDVHRGAVDTALHAAQCVLDSAARAVDGGVTEPEVLALRTRAVVAGCVEDVLRHVGHALGPTPLAFDAEHAARVADLTLYVRQHHAERDLAALGGLVAGTR